jgi:hypothetical protein
MITKAGKARWVYRCTLCEVERFAPDQLRIIEAQNRHLRGNFLHLQNAIVETFKPLVDFVKTFADVAEQTQKAFALVPPPNLPHDPALLRDRRKWGGR